MTYPKYPLGQLFRVRNTIMTNPWPGESAAPVQAGTIYKLVGQVEHALDLELQTGTGPATLRVLESQAEQFFLLASAECAG